MKIFVEIDIVQRIFEERFGGLQNFVDDWFEKEIQYLGERKSSRDASTIYAWLKNGLPSQRDTIFGFFGMLGVDPVSVIDLDRSGLPRKFGLLRAAFMVGGGATAGGFAPLFEIYRPATNWPDGGIASRFFKREWSVQEFAHDALNVSNIYATVFIDTSQDRPNRHPNAFHIAYRRKSNADGLWRPFGTIIDRERETILIHENGNLQRVSKSATYSRMLAFKTYFGPAPAEFRLASLDGFMCRVELQDLPMVTLFFEG